MPNNNQQKVTIKTVLIPSSLGRTASVPVNITKGQVVPKPPQPQPQPKKSK